jgi:type II secretory pathway pseudopilin PulG
MNKSSQTMRSITLKAQRGLTLFELIMFILVVSIVFTAGFNRFRDYPADAERANFQAILMQLRAGVNMQMMNAIAAGNWNQLELDGSNPMDLMLETPSNYIGAFELMDASTLPGRIWYFDKTRGELVYRVNNNEGLFEIVDGVQRPAEELRFRIAMKYRDANRNQWEGILLEPSVPYDWHLIAVDQPQTAMR